MSSAALVSVLVPCWGCRDYIRETIESALAQDYRSLEIIVVEDHGTDGTYEAALELRDPRLRVVRNDRNYGQYGNKNRALALASGEFIKYLDGDDVL
jgi:glycosyltransferase involved in cell wall biosynthesis